MTYAEDLPYWKTSSSSPDGWLTKAALEIQRAGGEVVAEGYGSNEGRAGFLLRFRLEDETFRMEWPVLESKYELRNSREAGSFMLSAKRQAATMLYHDVKSSCVKARALGARIAFFAHPALNDGSRRTAHELVSGDLHRAFPLALPSATDVVDAEIVK